jgi:predicted AAA+ superfamily ATPase
MAGGTRPSASTRSVVRCGRPRVTPAAVRVKDLKSDATREGVAGLLPYVADLMPLWETYLRIGGFPQAVGAWLKNGDVARNVVDALWDVVYGDAITSVRFAATQAQTFLAFLATNLCAPLNVARLARDVAVAQPTANDRLADLADHFLIWPCHREQSGMARPSAQRKWYFTDPLLARLAALRGVGAEPDLTQLTQQQVGLALLRNIGAQDAVSLADFDSVLFHRTSTGAEIDFVGQWMGDIAVESKYVDDRWAREMQTLRATRWFGILASRSGVDWRDDGWVIPAPLFAVLLGG